MKYLPYLPNHLIFACSPHSYVGSDLKKTYCNKPMYRTTQCRYLCMYLPYVRIYPIQLWYLLVSDMVQVGKSFVIKQILYEYFDFKSCSYVIFVGTDFGNLCNLSLDLNTTFVQFFRWFWAPPLGRSLNCFLKITWVFGVTSEGPNC